MQKIAVDWSEQEHFVEGSGLFQRCLSWGALALLCATSGCGAGLGGEGDDVGIGTSRSALSRRLENDVLFTNPTGSSSSFSTAGFVDLTGSFFQNLGTNGRTCNT